MKVRSYIGLLSSGSLGGALVVGLFGWWMLSGMNQSNRELEIESRNSGSSSSEYLDIQSFLSATRSSFEAFEIYPQNFSGIYGVVRDRLVQSKEGLNLISDKYSQNYSEEYLRPMAAGIKELEDAILRMEKASLLDNNNRSPELQVGRNAFQDSRETLSQLLNTLESAAETRKWQSQQSLDQKLADLRNEESVNTVLFFLASGMYLTLVGALAVVTYKSFASPIRKLEAAAKNSIDHNKPFTLRESGPYEVRSVTKRLRGLINSLESRVKQRTTALQKSNEKLQLEMQQRKELETQLVHAQKMEAVGQLASGIAHEINSPSQFANDNILFLKDATDGFIKKLNQAPDAPNDGDLEFFKENAPEAVEQAAEGISRITTIVKSMKNFAYRDAESAKRNNDLNQAIRSTVVVATNEWKYHAEMDLRLQEDLPLIPCNIGEINQVVLNLIVNGAHAIRDRLADGQKGNIVVSTRHYPDAGCVIIAIADNGGGIPQKVQARIFEPFFTTKEVGVGTGQGLAIAHNVIVKSHNGQIWFDSKEGIGTTFYIKLPMEQQNME
ncbi:MAG: sensor histidine kinase [Opitutales bacterium]